MTELRVAHLVPLTLGVPAHQDERLQRQRAVGLAGARRIGASALSVDEGSAAGRGRPGEDGGVPPGDLPPVGLAPVGRRGRGRCSRRHGGASGGALAKRRNSGSRPVASDSVGPPVRKACETCEVALADAGGGRAIAACACRRFWARCGPMPPATAGRGEQQAAEAALRSRAHPQEAAAEARESPQGVRRQLQKRLQAARRGDADRQVASTLR